jgi:bacterioferritin-associated ferredoxin
MNDPCQFESAGCRQRLVCRCLQITEEEIFEALSTGEVNDVRDIRRQTGAGDGCTACHRLLQQYVALRAYAFPDAPVCSVK